MGYDRALDTYILTWAKKIKAIEFLGGKCNECGSDDIRVLEFHHIEDKKIEISRLTNKRWSIVLAEIKKCRLLCGNCHATVHADAKGRKAHLKSKLLLINGKTCCEKCGNGNISILHFHHIGRKNFEISELLFKKTKVSIEELILEIERCKILCRNCHMLEHFDSNKFESNKASIYKKMRLYKEYKKLDYKEVKTMFDNGERKIDIARHFGCAKSSITMILKKRERGRKKSACLGSRRNSERYRGSRPGGEGES